MPGLSTAGDKETRLVFSSQAPRGRTVSSTVGAPWVRSEAMGQDHQDAAAGASRHLLRSRVLGMKGLGDIHQLGAQPEPGCHGGDKIREGMAAVLDVVPSAALETDHQARFHLPYRRLCPTQVHANVSGATRQSEGTPACSLTRTHTAPAVGGT